MINSLSDEFNDWKIIAFYYALYHLCLALLANKNFISKNHTATLIFIIKHYCEIKYEEIELIEQLQIKEEDANFYTYLKEKRHNANYSTNLLYDNYEIEEIRNSTISFLNKVKNILRI